MIKKIISAVVGLSYILLHELSHQRIFEIYQCEDIKWHLIYVTANCDLTTSVTLATSIAEIVGYSLIPILIILILIWNKGDSK